MLRVAVPNKGGLAPAAVEMLREAATASAPTTRISPARRRQRRRVLLPAPRATSPIYVPPPAT